MCRHSVSSQWYQKLSSLSYIHNVGKEPLQAYTMGTLFENSAIKYGDKTAIVSVQDNKRISFEELYKKSTKLTAGLISIGLQKGDRVGLWAPNVIEWVTTMAAIVQAGMVTVSLNPINHQKEELCYWINKVGIKAIVCPEKHKTFNFYDSLCGLVPELPSTDPGKLMSKSVPTLSTVITISKNTLKGTYNYNEILNVADEKTTNDTVTKNRNNSPDEICNIQYTSGTTGKSKAACITHFQQVNNAYHIGKRFGVTSNDNICVQVPLFHSFGTVAVASMAQCFGATLTLPSPTYNSVANLKAIEDEKCTILSGTPTMYVDLINNQRKEKRQINPTSAIIGGAPCSPQLFDDMMNTLNLKKINSIYGMTETTAVSFHSLPVEDHYKVRNTVGYIADHLEAKVVDNNNNTVPIGEPGELLIRGYSVMFGYWDDEEKNKQVLGPDRWYRTGDKFVLQEDGYGRVVGRLKDMIIRGGENIYPKEIEDVLNTHPDILESQVIGLSHERLGEEVCACIRLKENVHFNYDAVMEFCKRKLVGYKVPSQIKVFNNFPKTASGKVQKFALKQQIEEANASDRKNNISISAM
ncbi:hypothetical protein FQR65_LT03960 [Abscondita terminalis]|nr:hypothetical protein FQR65_LT03960 [Abscondita terminalis]